MERSPEPTYLLDQTFADVDDLVVKAKQWDLDFMQLDLGRFRGQLLQFGTGGVHVSDARFHRTLRQRGTPPVDMRTVAVPAVPRLQLEWRGKSIDGNSLMVFPKGSELSSVSGTDFHVYTFTISDDVLEEIGNALELGDLNDIINGAEAIRVSPDTIRNLRDLLGATCSLLRQDPDAISSDDISNRLRTTLPVRLLAAIADARDGCPDITGRKRIAAVSAAETYVQRHASASISVSDLCQVAGVSERTLRYAFHERFGIGPKEFLQTFRLIAVRRELCAADKQATRVADVANRWGFWHMGQFAADYRCRFGELPSATLRRAMPQYS